MKIAGVNVKDADKKLIIKITKPDVRRGALKNANSCAAANALCRQEHCDAARVHTSRAYIKQNRKWLRFAVPRALRDEIIAFDRGGEFATGEYVLSPLPPTMRLDAPVKKRANKTNPRRGKRAKRPYQVASGVRARMMADWE